MVLTKLNLPDILKTVTLEGEQRKGMLEKHVGTNPESNQSQVIDQEINQHRHENPINDASIHDNTNQESVDLNVVRIPQKRKLSFLSETEDKNIESSNSEYRSLGPVESKNQKEPERSLVDMFDLGDKDSEELGELGNIEIFTSKSNKQNKTNSSVVLNNFSQENPLYGIIQTQPELDDLELDELPDFHQDNKEKSDKLQNETSRSLNNANMEKSSNKNEMNQNPPDIDELPDLDEEEITKINLESSKRLSKPFKNVQTGNMSRSFSIIQTPPQLTDDFFDLVKGDDREKIRGDEESCFSYDKARRNSGYSSSCYGDTLRIGTNERNLENYFGSFLESSIMNHQEQSSNKQLVGTKQSRDDINKLFDQERKLSESELLEEAVDALTQASNEVFYQSPAVIKKQQILTPKSNKLKHFKFRKK